MTTFSATEMLDLMTKQQRSLLLFLETQAVDHGGLVKGEHMNADDFAQARRWNESGFLRFSRIPSDLLDKVTTYLTHQGPLLAEPHQLQSEPERPRQVLDRLDRQPPPAVHEGGERGAVDARRLRDCLLGPTVLMNRVP